MTSSKSSPKPSKTPASTATRLEQWTNPAPSSKREAIEKFGSKKLAFHFSEGKAVKGVLLGAGEGFYLVNAVVGQPPNQFTTVVVLDSASVVMVREVARNE